MRANIKALHMSVTSGSEKSVPINGQRNATSISFYSFLFFYFLDNLTIEDIMNDGRCAPYGKYSLTYYSPSTYMPRNKQVELKGVVDKKGLMPDGPVYSFSKYKRQTHKKPVTFSKEGKEPPHSYLKFKDWNPKKENKPPSKSVTKRKTYIDNIIDYNNKCKYPDPSHYFKEKKKEKPPSTKIDPKKFVRPCFLDDPQYLSMNNPAPGAYEIQVKI
jgi:hypothetical protein